MKPTTQDLAYLRYVARFTRVTTGQHRKEIDRLVQMGLINRAVPKMPAYHSTVSITDAGLELLKNRKEK